MLLYLVQKYIRDGAVRDVTTVLPKQDHFTEAITKWIKIIVVLVALTYS